MCQMMFQMLSQLYKLFFGNAPEVKDTEKLGTDEMERKITTLEEKISCLEKRNGELEKQLEQNRNKEAALQKVLCNYDNLLKKAIMEKNSETIQNETSLRLVNLESAFYDLLQKYEKAKFLVQDFQQNETVLKKQVAEYEDILDNLRSKFVAYKSSSEDAVEVKNELALKKIKSFTDSKGKKQRLSTTI